MGTLAPAFVQQFEDLNGRPIAGAKLYSWLAGTTTPTPLFQDAALTAAHPWPAVADGAGRLTAFMAPTSYKLELRDADDTVVVPAVDDIESVPSGQVNVDITGVAGENLAERQVVYLSDGTGGETIGRWYLGDADQVHKSSGATLVGVVVSPVIGIAASGQIRLQGTVEGYAGLLPGVTYYISATAGGLTNAAPTNAKVVGIAQSDTVLLLTPGASSSSDLGVFTQLQVTGTGVNAFVLSGGLQTASGAVQLVGADGRIPAIDSTRFASLSGANLTALNATQLTSGTVADARLSANIPRKNAAELVTGAWVFNEPVVLNNGSNSSLFLAHVGSGVVLRVQARGDNTSFIQFLQNDLVTSEGAIQGVAGGLNLLAGSALATVLSLTQLLATFGVPLSGTRINSHSAQPGFLALGSGQNISQGVTATVVLAERYDETGGFAGNTFTALVTGRYLLTATLCGSTSTSGMSLRGLVVTSNLSYPFNASGLGSEFAVAWIGVVDMDAGDTARVDATAGGPGGSFLIMGDGTAGSGRSVFSGRLMA